MSTVGRIVIVGGGQAGSCAAFGAREAGFQGQITLIGAEPHPPYERPPLSKATLTDTEPSLPALFAAGRYESGAIDLRLSSTIDHIDVAGQKVVLGTGESVAYDRLLLATGAQARRLRIPGAEPHIRYLRSYHDALALREILRANRRILCIGAGVIGLEIASTARALGCEVTVVEAGPGAMQRCVPPAESAYIATLYRGAGVDLRLATAITAIEAAADGTKHAHFADGSTVVADAVVAGIGMVRNTALATAAGIGVEDGITVDALGRTDAGGVYAAGDVAAFWHPLVGRRMRLESWHHAQDHGMAVGRAMAGAEEPYQPIPRFWTDQHGVHLQVAGWLDDADSSILRGERESGRYTALYLDKGGHVVGVVTANTPRDMRPAIGFIRNRVRLDPASAADIRIPLHKIPVEPAAPASV
jgi:3-phenylpropionate/trans-cinnamate dioxygenase ferredoxin reductase component